jgi:hypothetical protein
LLIESPRDFSLAAAALFNNGMAAVAGAPLSSTDPRLAKAVSALFTIRNKVAHQGYELQKDEARPLVQAAIDVFPWLDSLRGTDPDWLVPSHDPESI